MNFQGFCGQFNIAKLNPQQEAAVKKVSGATLLLATPGSGKTTVIVARAGYLVYVAGIPAQSILNLTYTRAAAKEMEERFVQKFRTSPQDTPKFSTINSFCVSVIKTCAREKWVPVPKLVTSNEKIVRDIAKNMMADYPSENDIRTLAQHIAKVKNEMTPIDAIESIPEVQVDFREFFLAYQAYLQKTGQMDFDDQLVMAYQLLQQYPDILARAHNVYQYVSLDEAQDTSLIQHSIVQLLVGRQGNIFMVGDEDQSIYGFRGAYPAALLSFSQNYDNAEVLYMETNYRSDKAIVNAANWFIKRNHLRNDKNMVAFSQENGTISVVKGISMHKEYEMVRDRIGEYLNRPNETLAILSKNNETLLPLLDWMDKLGLPAACRDASGPFFGHFLIIDLLNILAFAHDPTNGDLFSTLYYKLGLFISKQTFEETLKLSKELPAGEPKPEFLQLLAQSATNNNQFKRIETLRTVLNRITRVEPIIAIGMAMLDTGYENCWVNQKMDEGTSEQSMMLKFNYLRMIAEGTGAYEEFLARLKALKKVASTPGANITLSTIHSSKGLEFDHVIIIDALQGILPTGDVTLTEDEVEEEARMFYVGATRAKHTLELIIPKDFNGFPLKESAFAKFYESLGEDGTPREPVAEEPAENTKKIRDYVAKNPVQRTNLSGIRSGSKVIHTTYGKGIVNELTASGILTITFEDGQTKRFMKSSCEKNGALKLDEET